MSYPFKPARAEKDPAAESVRLYTTSTYFCDNESFHRCLESFGEGLPTGWRLADTIHRARVLLLMNEESAAPQFIVTRYSERMKRSDLFETSSSELAHTVLREWQTMSREELGYGLYVATSRPPEDMRDIPLLAKQLSQLHPDYRHGVWALIRADVPGGMDELLTLARECDLIP